MSTDPNVFCLMGPTASGKTALALEFLSLFPFEIISVDSAMIYREMDIGTAKPSAQELAFAPHHLIDIINPDETFSAAAFVSKTKALCEKIFKQSKIPLLVGGSCLYFSALQRGLAILPEKNEQLRQGLVQRAETEGWQVLYDELRERDPRSALNIHPKDKQRIQRALEVVYLTGKPLSSYFEETVDEPSFSFINLILVPKDRAWLHQRIALRLQTMLKQGLIDEVECLISKWSLTLSHPSMRTVGYRQTREYLEGDCDYDTFCAKAVAATRQLAKRQLTWLRHWPTGQVFSCDEANNMQDMVAVISKILDNS